MEAIKTSENVEFDVIYADGTRRHVSEGVLFEADGQHMTFHNGTSRPEVLFAVVESVIEIATDADLIEDLGKYLIKRADEREKEGGKNNGI